MKKNNHITNKLGKMSADVFFEIGDKVNLANLLRATPKKSYGKIPFKNDYEAMKHDWETASKEVSVALERFEREHREYELTSK